LEKIFDDLSSIQKSRRQWYQTSITDQGDEHKIKGAMKAMDEAFDNFTVGVSLSRALQSELSGEQTGLHLHIGGGVEDLQSNSNEIYQAITGHQDQFEGIKTRQDEIKFQLTEIGLYISFLPGCEVNRTYQRKSISSREWLQPL
jgi:hypothetical protein